MKITLDKNANWDSSTLGSFDGSSSLADQIDSDNNGIITNSEIQSYKKSHKSHTVIKDAETPENLDELSDLAKKATETYNGMEQEAKDIAEEDASILSQINTLENANSQAPLRQAKTCANRMDKLSEDFDTTASSVKKAIDEFKKKCGGILWLIYGAVDNICSKLEDKSDEVKQLIQTVHTNVDNTEKRVEEKLGKDTSEEKTKKTKKD